MIDLHLARYSNVSSSRNITDVDSLKPHSQPIVCSAETSNSVKVTIRPEFFGIVPNFGGLSRKKYGVIRNANCPELWTLFVPNLSWFNVKICCSSSTWSKCSWSFWVFCLSEMRSVELVTHKIHFRPGLRPGPSWGSSGRAPKPLSRIGRGIYPLPITFSLNAFGVLISASSPSRKVSRISCISIMYLWSCTLHYTEVYRLLYRDNLLTYGISYKMQNRNKICIKITKSILLA